MAILRQNYPSRLGKIVLWFEHLACTGEIGGKRLESLPTLKQKTVFPLKRKAFSVEGVKILFKKGLFYGIFTPLI